MQGAGPGLASTLSRAIPGRWGPRSSTVWARSCTQRGRGVLQAAGAHFKVSSIIHRHLDELPACCEQPGSHPRRAASGSTGRTPEGSWVSLSRMGGPLGRRGPPCCPRGERGWPSIFPF